MKLITKAGCPRCVNIKEYLKGNSFSYEEVYVENPTDLDVYRQMLIDNDRPLGFPILIKGSEIINGETEVIIEWLTKQNKEESIYSWGR